MKKFLLVILSVSLLIGDAFAETSSSSKAENPADTDYLFIKIDGRLTVSGDSATFYLTGKNAKALYYHMKAKAEKNRPGACVNGMTKFLPGMMCSQFFEQKKENFECHIAINIKTGRIDSSPVNDESCPEKGDEETYKYYDALNDKL
jgi:hypothetical protein